MRIVDEAPTPGHFEVKAGVGDHFAWLRTRLALERTAMAWIRTSIALIGFGFTIVQFFQRLQGMQGISPAMSTHTPRYFGLALIGSGVLALTLSLAQYRRFMSYMWEDEFKSIAGIHSRRDHTPLLATATVLLLIGVFAFVAVLVRMP
jgi:putative membrane protein